MKAAEDCRSPRPCGVRAAGFQTQATVLVFNADRRLIVPESGARCRLTSWPSSATIASSLGRPKTLFPLAHAALSKCAARRKQMLIREAII